MKICPRCSAAFEDASIFCYNDGTRLVEAPQTISPPAHDDADPLVGRVLKNTYRLEKKIGGGGMGVVYAASHVDFAKQYAIKILQLKQGNDPTLPDRFKKEAEISGNIAHPNVVSVSDYGQTPDGLLFMVMEHVVGENLRTLLRREKKFSIQRAIKIFAEICEGINAAHEIGVAHRDLKPENVMIQNKGGQERARVLDFGIAKLKDVTMTLPGSILGTPIYMSPEQWKSEKIDHRSDIYTLGVMLYEMLSGRAPFSGDNWKVLFYKHTQEMPESLSEICPDLPGSLCKVVMRALEKDPEKRQQSIKELFNEIDAALKPAESSGPFSSPDDFIFISYASGDSRRVLQMADELEASGLKVRIDREKIEDSAIYGLKAAQAIKSCAALMLACSDVALRSRNVKQEILLAWKYAKPILPVMLERTAYPEQLEYWLEGSLSVDVMNHPKQQWLPKIHQALGLQDLPAAQNRAQLNDQETVKIPTARGAGKPPAFRGMGAIPKGAQPDPASTKIDDRLARSRQALAALQNIAIFTDQLWPIPADSSTSAEKRFRGLGAPQDGAKRNYRLNQRVRLALEYEREGHLLLINQGADGIIYCLCPSHFAANTRIQAGRSYFPQADSQYDSFILTGEAGREHILAIITDDPLSLDWMPTGDEPARTLDQIDIDLLVQLLRSLSAEKWTALSTYFLVTE